MKNIAIIFSTLLLLQFSLTSQAFLFKLDSRGIVSQESKMFGAFITSGGEEFVVVVYGPELQNFNVENFLPDPRITIVDQECNLKPETSLQECIVAESDDWRNDNNSDFIQAIGLNPNFDHEVATYLKIPPGVKSYTYFVSGSNASSRGEAVVAIFRVQKDPENVRFTLEVKRDLSRKLGLSIDEIKTVYVEQTLWKDSTLRCPEQSDSAPSPFPFLTPHIGHIIVLHAKGFNNYYIYHTDSDAPLQFVPFATTPDEEFTFVATPDEFLPIPSVPDDGVFAPAIPNDGFFPTVPNDGFNPASPNFKFCGKI